MTREEKIEKLRNLTKAYVLYSQFTKLPYLECEQASFYDQAFIFETKEDGEEAAKRLCAQGDICGVAEMNLVPLKLPISEEKKEEPANTLMRNQVREHLMRFPTMGLNAVFFKAAGEKGEVLPLDDILPDPVKDQLEQTKNELSGLQLTGMYFAQCMRKQQKDPNQLRECAEEFHANLVRSELLLPVIPEDEHLDDKSLNIAKCKLPFYPLKQEEGEKPATLLALFTNMDEVAMHCRKNPKNVRVVRIPFGDVPQILRDPMIGCVVDPLSFSIAVQKDDIPKLVSDFKKED